MATIAVRVIGSCVYRSAGDQFFRDIAIIHGVELVVIISYVVDEFNNIADKSVTTRATIFCAYAFSYIAD